MARKESLLRLQQQLLKRRDALRKALAGDLSMLYELSDQSQGDMADMALGISQDEISSQLAEAESRELGQIEWALERLSDGNYGKCESCGQPIALARLQALPYATMCIECQRDAEDRGVNTRGSYAHDFGVLPDFDDSDREPSINDIEMDVG